MNFQPTTPAKARHFKTFIAQRDHSCFRLLSKFLSNFSKVLGHRHALAQLANSVSFRNFYKLEILSRLCQYFDDGIVLAKYEMADR